MKINSEQPETTTRRKRFVELGLRQIPEEQNRGVMGGTGFEVDSPSETTTDFLVTTCGNSDESENDNLGLTGAQTGALDAEDAGLQGLIDVWPRLPLDTIKQILKLAGLE